MIEKRRISCLQMSLLLYTNVISTAVLIVPGITYAYAERDMWMSPIWGSLTGFLMVYIVYRLNKLYPKETPIQFSQHILGRISGKVVGFLYLFFLLVNCGYVIRAYGDFLVGAFLNRTPLLLVMGSLALASSFAVRAGLEVLGRLSEVFVPFIILLWLLLVLLLVPELDVKNMFPIMENGILPSLKGAVAPLSWNAIFFYMSFLLPFLNNREQGMKWGMLSVIAVTITLFITNIATIFLFGNITGQFVYPVMSASRYISYADFFENLEAVVMAIWIGGLFIKIAFYQYVLVQNTALWLNLSDYKSLALPIGLLITIFGVWGVSNFQELSHFLDVIIPFTSLTYYIIIPVILLMIALVQNRNRQAS